MIVWKVVKSRAASKYLGSGTGEYLSAAAVEPQRVIYRINRWTKAPSPCKPLFVFRTRNHATMFASGHGYRVFRAQAVLHKGTLSGWLTQDIWPHGTLFADKVKLIR